MSMGHVVQVVTCATAQTTPTARGLFARHISAHSPPPRQCVVLTSVWAQTRESNKSLS